MCNLVNMEKLTSYQRLKAERQKLIEDIYVLTMLDHSKKPKDVIKFFGVKTSWTMKFNLEKLIWAGDNPLHPNR